MTGAGVLRFALLEVDWSFPYTNLYDGGGKDAIPFDGPEQFSEKYLK